MLIEVRLSPQINTWVYGFFQHDFVQMMRYGGFRPIVFLPHGLWAAFFALMTLVAAVGLWRFGPPARRASYLAAAGYLGVLLVLCKSAAVLVYAAILVPAVRLLSVRQQIRIATALALFAVLFPLLRGADLVPVDWIVEQAEAVSQERADSLQYRLDNEDALLARASERPLFGWGSWGRNHIHDPFTGEIISTTDGRWIIVIGSLGWCGYIVEFGLLALPLLLLARASATRWRACDRRPTAGRIGAAARVQHDRHAAERDPHPLHLADGRSAARLRGGPRAQGSAPSPAVRGCRTCSTPNHPLRERTIASRPRVLLIAEAANPEWVSVPLVGWSLCDGAAPRGGRASRHAGPQPRRNPARRSDRGPRLHRHRLGGARAPGLASRERAAHGGGQGLDQRSRPFDALSYPYFEHLVWKAFGDRLAAAQFDLVHRVTPLSPTVPSPIAAKCRRIGVPFVVGPLNGGVPWPPGFDADRRREREWLSYVRGAYRLLPGRAATLGSGAVIVGSRHTEREIPARFRQRCVYIPENGIDPTRFTKRARHEPGPLRACFIGRMVPYKGPDMLLEAAAPLLRDGRMTLDMIGDGPMLGGLVASAAACGLAVRFHGWLPHAEVQDVAATCTVLAFPSVREFGGGVVLEAMALGLAPVVVDYGGPGELVTANTGFSVPLGRRHEIVDALGATLERLAADPTAVARAGAARAGAGRGALHVGPEGRRRSRGSTTGCSGIAPPSGRAVARPIR